MEAATQRPNTNSLVARLTLDRKRLLHVVAERDREVAQLRRLLKASQHWGQLLYERVTTLTEQRDELAMQWQSARQALQEGISPTALTKHP